MKLLLIPPGEFQMGSQQSTQDLLDLLVRWKAEPGFFEPEFPSHAVRISRPFYIARTETTQAEYVAVIGDNPSSSSAENSGKFRDVDPSKLPVQSVTWYDAIQFCNLLSSRDGFPPYYHLDQIERDPDSLPNVKVPTISTAMVSVLGGNGYRLPTEAEWEYACRGGTKTAFWSGNTIVDLDRAGWYGSAISPEGNSKMDVNVVGLKDPNPFGLVDMHGNVKEWCEDLYDPAAYSRRTQISIDPVVTPAKQTDRDQRVIRGGDATGSPIVCRSSSRGAFFPSTQGPPGFRVAKDP